MSDDSFIEVNGLFVTPSGRREYSNYEYLTLYKQESIEKGNETTVTFDFQGEIAIIDPSKTNKIKVLGKRDTYFYFSDKEDDIKNIYLKSDTLVLYSLMQELLKHNKKTLNDPLIDSFYAKFDAYAREKINFMEKYGIFTLAVNKHLLDPGETTKIKNLSSNLDNYLLESSALNDKLKELKKEFNQNIAKYFAEKHASYTTKGYFDNGEDTYVYSYLPLKSNSLFTSITFNKNSALLFEAIKKDTLAGKSFLDNLSSVAEKNALKTLKGYIVYVNREEGQADGFLDKSAYVDNNMLKAQIFETTKQAHSFAKRRGFKSNLMVVEINFTYSQINENHNCSMGPAMQSLISRREQSDLKEIFQDMPAQKVEDTSVAKKNKI